MSRIPKLETDPNNLTQEKKNEIGARLSERIQVLPPCELCGRSVWGFNSRVVSPMMLMQSETPVLSIDMAVAHPCALLQCGHCGNSKMLSLGVLEIEPFEG